MAKKENKKARGQMQMTDKIIAYECGEMDDGEAVAFFQELIDNGLAWKLQGSYGRTARALIDGGYCYEPEGV